MAHWHQVHLLGLCMNALGAHSPLSTGQYGKTWLLIGSGGHGRRSVIGIANDLEVRRR